MRRKLTDSITQNNRNITDRFSVISIPIRTLTRTVAVRERRFFDVSPAMHIVTLQRAVLSHGENAPSGVSL